MNKDGNKVDKKDDFGGEVTHAIICPEYYLVTDKVGGNSNKKGKHNKKLVTKKRTI